MCGGRGLGPLLTAPVETFPTLAHLGGNSAGPLHIFADLALLVGAGLVLLPDDGNDGLLRQILLLLLVTFVDKLYTGTCNNYFFY
jgi:drug/metabolite transporter (DMT)-like permease